jgi:ubiquinone/menaquinone biosynthesis C-methylase UbiE
MSQETIKLKLLPLDQYIGDNRYNPIRFYYWPIFGSLYRRRVELCLEELCGGERILEVGFGSGLTFLNLNELYSEIYGLDLTAQVNDIMAMFHTRGIEAWLQNGNVLDMPYPDGFFDSVLLISILEHLKPQEISKAFDEISRVLKPGGQVVYGVPVERRLMVLAFRLLGYDIHKHHFSTEKEINLAVSQRFVPVKITCMYGFIFSGAVYEVGHFKKER